MPGLNTTGRPQTTDYNLGRGILYAAPLVNGIPGPYRDLGNCTEFTISAEQEELEHQSSREGLRVTDKRVTLSQSFGISFTLDELNFENQALFFAGTTSTTGTNGAIAGFAKHELVSDLEVGRWYDIKSSTGVRAYNIEAADLTVEEGATTLVLGTDYELDLVMGRIFFPGSVNAAAGDDIDVTLAANATAGGLDQVNGLLSSSIPLALKFVGKNPANEDKATEYQFHQVTFAPEGDFSLIGDDWTTIPLTGTAERNAAVPDVSKTLTITYPRSQP
jgi:hypothetical protein